MLARAGLGLALPTVTRVEEDQESRSEGSF